MNSQQTYTTHMTQYFIIPNLILPPNTPFSLLGFDSSTECSWCHRVIRCCKESVAGLPFWALLVGTRLLLRWLNPDHFLVLKLQQLLHLQNQNITLKRTFLPRVSPNDRNKTHVLNTWVHKYKSIRWWTNLNNKLRCDDWQIILW